MLIVHHSLMIHTFLIRVRVFILFLFFVSGCNQRESDRIEELKLLSHSIDSLRDSLKLPSIPKDFELERGGMDFVVWKAAENNYPRFDVKSIFWDSSGIYLERNFFYKTPEERLQIYCYFRKVRGIDTTGVCYWYEKSSADTGRFISPSEARVLLSLWGLNEQR